jgi:hypothetical protein
MGQKVKIAHKDVPNNVAVVDMIAFKRLWEEKGWKIVPDEKTADNSTDTTKVTSSTDTKKTDNT